ncbi:hypothetical protein [Spiroplasma endosymbiont of Labia minor]|uniref:hypothetical protein n=1 Tax=Spiroplasma endosymbiont of Labia minor TaxID=3066305 RepID=UPI0030CD6738
MNLNPYERIKKEREDKNRAKRQEELSKQIFNNFDYSNNNINSNVNLTRNPQINQTSTSIPINQVSNISQSPNFIKNIKSGESVLQFFGIFGDYKVVKNMIATILNQMRDVNTIVIKIKRVFLYSTPYLFFLKQIINSLPIVSLEDKRVLWARVSIFLSVTEYGKSESDYMYKLSESLNFDDPIIMIRNEFKDIFNAYSIKAPICIILDDFRGINYEETTKIINLTTSLFSTITNMKFIIDMNIPTIQSYFNINGGSYDNWLSLFDEVLNDSNILKKMENTQVTTSKIPDFLEPNKFNSANLSSNLTDKLNTNLDNLQTYKSTATDYNSDNFDFSHFDPEGMKNWNEATDDNTVRITWAKPTNQNSQIQSQQFNNNYENGTENSNYTDSIYRQTNSFSGSKPSQMSNFEDKISTDNFNNNYQMNDGFLPEQLKGRKILINQQRQNNNINDNYLSVPNSWSNMK